MPTINKRFLVRLVLCLAVFAGFLAGAHALQARRIPDALKRQADRAADAGKTEQAVHYLRQYLEFEPADVESQVRLAGLLKQRTPTARTLTELVFLYDKILRLDPARADLRRDAVTQSLRLGRYADAAAHAEALLQANPADAEVWELLGVAHAGQNQLADAQRAFEEAVKHAPDKLLPYQRLAQLVWKNLNQPLQARAVLDRMVAANPQDPDAHLSRAKFAAFLLDEATRTNRPADPEPVLRDLRRVLEIDPENADASLLLAEQLQKGRDIPAAHAILRDAAGLYPRDLRLVRGLAWLELIRGNTAAALAVLEDGLKGTPDGFDLLVPLADLLVQQGDTARPADILRRLEGRKAPPTQVKYLKARLAMRQEKWAEAVALLDALRAETLSLPGLEAQVNMLLASCYERTGDADAQEKAYKRVTAADPANPQAHAGLATLYLNRGRFDDAARAFEAATRSAYTPGTVHAQAVRLKARMLRLRGGSAEDWQRLDRAATAAAAAFGPVSSDALVLRADVLAARGKYREAVAVLKKEAGGRPGDTRLWAALADAAAEAGGTAAGLEVIDEAQAAAGDGPDVRLARARLYAREPGRVRPIDPLADRIDGWADADQLRLLYGLVEVYDETGEKAKVVATLRKVTTRRPTDVAVWLRLYERAVEAGDTATATEARAAVVKLDGVNSPSALLCDPAVTAERLTAAFGASPDRADACLALAKAKAGDDKEVERLTDRAFDLEPTRYETARAKVLRLARLAEPQPLAAFAARVNADPRWAGEPFRRLMGGAVRRLDTAGGRAVLAACGPLVANDPGGLGWLAETADRDPKAYARAAESAVATADDWLRLALLGKPEVAMAAGRGKLSPAAFAAAAAIIKERPAGESWLPPADTPADRRALVQARLAVKLSRADSAGATAVLERYLGDAPPAVDAAWARRNLAMLLAVGGRPEDRAKAMTLIREAGANGSNPDELRATAGVLTTLARYLEGEDRRAVLAEAAAALDAVVKATKSRRDLYHLSQVYRAAGNRVEARKCLNQLIADDGNNLYYLVTALDELTEERQFDYARNFAARLRSNYPGEFRAVAAVARYEARAGRPDAALAIADQYAAAADSGAGDYLARSGRVAELLDELARVPGVRGTAAGRRMADAAAERYAALVPTRAEAVVGLVGCLADDGRVTEAFAKIDQLGQQLPVRTKAAAGLAALRPGGGTDRQFDAVRGWLAAARSEDADSIPLRLNEAELFALAGDYPKATAAFEAVLAKDPRNVVALNNLAWTLAADPARAAKAVELIGRAARETGLSGELLDTRARARITLKQFADAKRDLDEAMTHEPTALRSFHLAVLYLAQSPPRAADAAAAFAAARAKGLEARAVHPADLPTFRTLENAEKRASKSYSGPGVCTPGDAPPAAPRLGT